MSKKEIIEKRTGENRKTREFFIGYMKGRLYEVNEGNLFKGYVRLIFMNGGFRVRATDMNPEHKFPHIVLCLTPTNKQEADVFYKLLEFNVKEIGVKADRLRKNEGEK